MHTLNLLVLNSFFFMCRILFWQFPSSSSTLRISLFSYFHSLCWNDRYNCYFYYRNICILFLLAAFKMLSLCLGFINFAMRYKNISVLIYIVFILLLFHWILTVTWYLLPTLVFYLKIFKHHCSSILSLLYFWHLNYTCLELLKVSSTCPFFSFLVFFIFFFLILIENMQQLYKT